MHRLTKALQLLVIIGQYWVIILLVLGYKIVYNQAVYPNHKYLLRLPFMGQLIRANFFITEHLQAGILINTGPNLLPKRGNQCDVIWWLTLHPI